MRFILIFLFFIVEINATEESLNSMVVESNSSSASPNIQDILNSSQDVVSVDKELFKIALLEKNVKYCSLINNKNKKIECFGIIKRNSGYCNMIKDKDLKNKCLSVALSDESLCDNIADESIKKECVSLDK